jgi:hypothetical protein
LRSAEAVVRPFFCAGESGSCSIAMWFDGCTCGRSLPPRIGSATAQLARMMLTGAPARHCILRGCMSQTTLVLLVVHMSGCWKASRRKESAHQPSPYGASGAMQYTCKSLRCTAWACRMTCDADNVCTSQLQVARKLRCTRVPTTTRVRQSDMQTYRMTICLRST